MNKLRIEIILIGFVLSLPVWAGINFIQGGAENLFFLQRISVNPNIISAAAGVPIVEKFIGPVRDTKIENPEITAKTAISVWIDETGKEKTLYEKNSNMPLPIASLTKLITADVVLENYDLFQDVVFSKKAIASEEDIGNFRVGENFYSKDLLYSLLMESSNDAAYALSEVVGYDAFVDLMNLETKKILGPSLNTAFFNPTGLDPKTPEENANYSTAGDLEKIAVYFIKNQPLIWEITKNSEFNLYSPDEVFHHKIVSTNDLLSKFPEIIGGKTGSTDAAGGCLVLVLKSSKQKGFLVNVILGSGDRFGEMEKLIDWDKSAYKL